MTEPDQDDGLARLENIVNNIRACLSDGPQAKGLERLLNKMSVCLDGLDGAAGDRFSPIVGEISIVLRKVYEVKRDSSRLKSLQTLVSLLDYLRQGPAAAAGGAGSPAALALEQARMEEHGRVVSLFAMASLRHLQPGGVSSEKLLALPLLEAYAGVVEALTKGSAGKAFLESLAASFAAGAPGLESDAVPLVVGMMGGLSLLPAPLGVAVRLMGVAYRALKGWGRLAQSESSSPATTAYAEAVRALERGGFVASEIEGIPSLTQSLLDAVQNATPAGASKGQKQARTAKAGQAASSLPTLPAGVQSAEARQAWALEVVTQRLLLQARQRLRATVAEAATVAADTAQLPPAYRSFLLAAPLSDPRRLDASPGTRWVRCLPELRADGATVYPTQEQVALGPLAAFEATPLGLVLTAAPEPAAAGTAATRPVAESFSWVALQRVVFDPAVHSLSLLVRSAAFEASLDPNTAAAVPAFAADFLARQKAATAAAPSNGTSAKAQLHCLVRETVVFPSAAPFRAACEAVLLYMHKRTTVSQLTVAAASLPTQPSQGAGKRGRKGASAGAGEDAAAPGAVTEAEEVPLDAEALSGFVAPEDRQTALGAFQALATPFPSSPISSNSGSAKAGVSTPSPAPTSSTPTPARNAEATLTEEAYIAMQADALQLASQTIPASQVIAQGPRKCSKSGDILIRPQKGAAAEELPSIALLAQTAAAAPGGETETRATETPSKPTATTAPPSTVRASVAELVQRTTQPPLTHSVTKSAPKSGSKSLPKALVPAPADDMGRSNGSPDLAAPANEPMADRQVMRPSRLASAVARHAIKTIAVHDDIVDSDTDGQQGIATATSTGESGAGGHGKKPAALPTSLRQGAMGKPHTPSASLHAKEAPPSSSKTGHKGEFDFDMEDDGPKPVAAALLKQKTGTNAPNRGASESFEWTDDSNVPVSNKKTATTSFVQHRPPFGASAAKPTKAAASTSQTKTSAAPFISHPTGILEASFASKKKSATKSTSDSHDAKPSSSVKVALEARFASAASADRCKDGDIRVLAGTTETPTSNEPTLIQSRSVRLLASNSNSVSMSTASPGIGASGNSSFFVDASQSPLDRLLHQREGRRGGHSPVFGRARGSNAVAGQKRGRSESPPMMVTPMHGFNGGGYGGGGDDDELTAAEAIQMLEYNLAHDRINAAEYVLGVMDLARRLSERLAESMTPQGSSNGYALPPNGIQEMCAKAVANSKQVIGRLKKTTEQNLDASAVRARGQLEASATQLVSTIVGATPGHTQSPEARRKADEAVAVFRGRLQALQTIRLKAEAAVADAVTAYKRRLEEVEAALTSTVGQAEQEREAIVAEFSKKARQRFEAAEAQVRQQTERRWGLGHRPLHAATPRAHGTVHRKVMGGTHGGRQHTGSRSMSSQQDLADIADLLA